MNPIRNLRKKKKSWGGKATLPPEGGKVSLPPSNKGEQEIFRDDKDVNGFKNGIKLFTDRATFFQSYNGKQFRLLTVRMVKKDHFALY